MSANFLSRYSISSSSEFIYFYQKITSYINDYHSEAVTKQESKYTDGKTFMIIEQACPLCHFGE